MSEYHVFEPYSQVVKFTQQRLLWPYYAIRFRQAFDQVPVYTMFLGYPRSGHTLLGGLLDAHPDTWITHELNVLKYINKGYKRNTIFAKLIGRGKWFKARNQIWTGYSYKVPGQWQGSFRQLKVIGDKRGGFSTRLLHRYPDLLDKLYQTIDKDVRIIHNVRNPFDNIATRARGGNLNPREVDEALLYETIEKHFRDIATINRYITEGHNILTARHEDFIASPKDMLIRLCHYLDLAPYQDYLNDAAGIVNASTRKSRHKITWPEKAVRDVQERIRQYPFLQGYDFEH